jgi:undecaprenyl-diphosphatase
MTYFEAIVIAIVEGITEFLPISSTGHMILTSSILGIEYSPFYQLYIISIQFGAILSVIFLYWNRFFQSITFYFLLVAAVIPTALIAFLLKKYVDQAIGNVTIVAINLMIGGIIMIFLENYFKNKTQKSESLTYLQAIKIGLVQAISIFPGVSRSASTIYGGLSQGLSRVEAAEFSFFLAVPIMFLATAKDMYDYLKGGSIAFKQEEVNLLILGNIVAFIVAAATIKYMISFIQKNGFLLFAYYRILVGIIVLAFLGFGFNLKMV